MSLLDILIPLYILISLGYVLKKYQFPNQDFWPGIERMTYYVLFPTLIFVALLKAEIDLTLIGKVFIVICIPAILSGLFQWLGFLSSNLSGPTFSSMFQGAVRNNTMISLVIAAWLVPENGLVIMAIIILIMVPFNNLTSIFILLRYGNTEENSPTQNNVLANNSAPANNSALANKNAHKNLWLSIIKNPLIIACLLGLSLNILDVKLAKPLVNTADFLGRSALPFALLAVGAGLKFGSLFEKKLAITLSSFAKLILTPLLSWGLCILFDAGSDLTKVAIIFSAMPTAVSAFILAKQMGGDADAMAQIITIQTLLAALSIPVFLLIAQQF